MRVHRHVPAVNRALPVLILLSVVATRAPATDRYWNVATGDWNTPGSWLPTVVPGAGDKAIIDNAGTATISAAVPGVTQIVVGSASTGVLSMTGGSVATSANLNVEVGSTADLSGGLCNLGDDMLLKGALNLSGTAQLSMVDQLRVNGGTLTQTGGGLTAGNLLRVFNGGSYGLSVGTCETAKLQVQSASSMTHTSGDVDAGVLDVQSGASHTVSGGTLDIGTIWIMDGTTDFGGGSATVNVGDAGNPFVQTSVNLANGTVQNSGSAVVNVYGSDSIVVVAPGQAAGFSSLDLVDGGSLHTLGNTLVVASGETVRMAGKFADRCEVAGTLGHLGSNLWLNGGLALSGSGQVALGNGKLRADQTGAGASSIAGTATLTADVVHVGYDGSGEMSITGGTVTLTDGFKVANNAAWTGTVTQNGGAVNVAAGMRIAADAAGNGTYHLIDGTLGVTGGIAIGGDGTGRLEVDGGAITGVGALQVRASGVFQLDDGIVGRTEWNVRTGGQSTQTGGTLTATVKSAVATGATATLSGGQCNIGGDNNNITVSGTLNLSGTAELWVDDDVKVNGGTFTQTGGEVTATDLLRVYNGGGYGLSDGACRADGSVKVEVGSTFDLSGGALSTPKTIIAGQFNFTGGELKTAEVEGSLTNAGGTFAPGQSVAATQITGDYSQSATGTLVMEIEGAGGGEYDVLHALGGADLGGTLRLDFTNFGGAADDLDGRSLTLLQADTGVSNDFAQVALDGFSAIEIQVSHVVNAFDVVVSFAEVLDSAGIAAGPGASGSLYGGSTSVGGLDVTFDNVTGGGDLTVDFDATPLGQLEQGYLDTINFALWTNPLQTWSLEFDGTFDGETTLTFCYDDSDMFPGRSEDRLYIHHQLGDGTWEELPVVARDTVANTITVTTTSFSDFAMGGPVPEPTTLVLLALGGVMLLKRKRRGAS